MYFVSAVIRLVQEVKSKRTADYLASLVETSSNLKSGDKILLEYYMDILGNENQQVLEYAYLNSLYHSGVKNHLDSGILEVKGWETFYADALENNFKKVDSLPFDYQRKIASVLVNYIEENQHILIVKGGVEEILNKCKTFEYKNQISDFDEDCRTKALEMTGEMSQDGMKLVAVAYKKVDSTTITAKTETDLSTMDENQILQRVETTEIFDELTPEQKSFYEHDKVYQNYSQLMMENGGMVKMTGLKEKYRK